MPRHLVSVCGPTASAEFGPYPSKEAMRQAFAAEGSEACRGKVEVRPFRTVRCLATLLEP